MSKIAAGILTMWVPLQAPATVIGFCLAELGRACCNEARPLHRPQHAQAALSASAHRAVNRRAGSRLLVTGLAPQAQARPRQHKAHLPH